MPGRRYISYAKNKCGPRLGEDAVEKLKNHFVQIRSVAQKQYLETQKRAAIPITIRQLEAMVRISESLAKMRLAPFATDKDVEEAIRLFKVSTMSAALAGGSEGAADQSTMDEVLKVETLLKRRFPVGSRGACGCGTPYWPWNACSPRPPRLPPHEAPPPAHAASAATAIPSRSP